MTLGGALSAVWEAARTISVVIAWTVVIATGLLDEGRYASISEMAASERIDRGYLGRVCS